jgi:hypothetical protein
MKDLILSLCQFEECDRITLKDLKNHSIYLNEGNPII